MILPRFAPILLATSVAAFECHVAPGGDDAAAGTVAAPFATLDRARDEIRKSRTGAKGESAAIILHGGELVVRGALALDARDSGLRICAAEGGTPRLLGSAKVTGWRKHERGILKADVSGLLPRGVIPKQLLCDGERQVLARWPNADPAEPLYGGWAFVQPIPPGREDGHRWKREFYVAERDVRRWAHPEDVEVDIFAYYGWWNWIVPIEGVDAAARKLVLAKDCGYDIHPHNRFHLQNAIEELDAPREWYFDRRSQVLYFWPPGPVEGHDVRIPVADGFVRIGPGAREVTIEGLTFHGCTGTAVSLDRTESCIVRRCTIAHCGGFGGTGVSAQGGRGNRVVACEVSHTGGAGVSVGGGDRITLAPADNAVENCHIHHVGVINKNGAGVGLGGVGNRVAHNLIEHCPRMAVQFSGNNLLIEHNRIRQTVLETQDGGALYTGGRDWISSRGTLIRHNFITDTVGVGQEKEGLRHPFFTWGIYLDDNTGGVDVVGNIVARSGRASLHLHNARDCVVENNILVDGREKQVEYDGWSREQHYIRDHMPTMIRGWESVKDEPAWRGMRGMGVDPRNAFFEDGTMMSGNVIRGNIVAWRDGSVRYVDFRHVTAAHNLSDNNLIWNGGGPVRTPVSRAGRDTGDDLLGGAGVFRVADEGRTPKGWGFNHRPNDRVRCVVRDGALVTDAGTGPDPANSHSVIHSPPMPLTPGGTYRARLKVRGDPPNLAAGLALYAYEGGKGYWQTASRSVSLTREWQEIEVSGVFPQRGELAWKDWMQRFWLRLDVQGAKGAVWIREVTVRAAEPRDTWRSWQEDGWDRHSIIADPKFADWAGDDYSLRRDSPAWRLGFREIPVERIGPETRAIRAGR